MQMSKYFFFSSLLVCLSLFSCKENSAQQNTILTDQDGFTYETAFDGIEAFLDYQKKVDQRSDLQNLRSLLYTHKNGMNLQSTAKIDNTGELAKAELNKVLENGQQLNYTFYFLKGVLSTAKIENVNQEKSQTHVVFFNAEQSPIASYICHSTASESEPNNNLKLNKNKPSFYKDIESTLQQLSDLQNQEGDFTLHFLGFNEAYNKRFIEFGNDTYTTNLAFIPQETLVQKIQSNPKPYRNKTFNIQFQEITEASGFSYQLLTEILLR
jgi:peptide subunit release factor 1 (eRF1)